MSWRPLPGRSREPRPVGESLERLARHLGTPPPEALTRLFEGWEELVGAAVAAHTRPLSLTRGVLAIVVDQPGWAAQVGWLETELLRRFEERLGTGVVTSIAVRVRPG